MDKIVWKKGFKYMKSALEYFEEIMKIPRPSGKEEKILEYLVNYAKENNIEYHIGKYNTLFLRKNNKSEKTIILHAHSDMVCVSTNEFDFDNNGIPYYIDGDFYRSKCTSLGADDGIGVAIILAMLQENENMPNIEVIITSQEETTMIGAMNFDYSLVTGKTLISLDGINEGDIESSSAGMCSTTINKKISFANCNDKFYKLSIKGLAGGHSGDDMDKGRSNAIKIVDEILGSLDAKITNVNIGRGDNVIPNDGYVDFSSIYDLETINEKISSIDFKLSDDDLSFSYVVDKTNETVVVSESKEIISFLNELKSGLLETFDDGFPLLSANIGKISIDNDILTIKYSIRSSDKSKEISLLNEVENLCSKYGFLLNVDTVKPFFEFKENSNIREILKASYKDLFGKDAVTKKVHACMECGVLSNSIEGVDICTIAPTILHCHSVNENVSISSTKRVYEWLKDTLQRFNSK